MKEICLGLLINFLSIAIHAQDGNFEWAKSMEGLAGTSITTDVSGNVYVTGRYEGIADFDPGAATFNLNSNGGRDVFIQKLDANGSFLWAKSVGGTLSDETGTSITTDASGNVYVTGWFEGTADFDPGAATFNLNSNGGRDVFVLKLDANGNFIWAKSMGGTSEDSGSSLAVDGLGNVYVTGSYKGPADFDPGSGTFSLTSNDFDVFILKLDGSGNFIWAKSMGGTLSDHGFSITIDISGNVYVTGKYFNTVDFDPGAANFNLTSIGYEDIFILKLDADGIFLWAKSIGGGSYDRGFSITTDASGNVYVTGKYFNTMTVTFNLTSNGLEDVFILKLDADGNFLWAKSIGGTSYDRGFSITTDVSGNVYVTGYYEGTVDFDPGAAIFNLTSNGYEDVFILNLDTDGNFLWAKSIGGTSTDIGFSITTDTFCYVYVTGYYGGTVDFDPGAATFNLTSNNAEDVFILKLKSNLALISNETKTICAGEGYKGYTATGVYVDTLIGQEGCDTLRNLNLTVLDALTSDEISTICNGEEYAGYTSTGIYIDTLIAQSGCDSIRTLDLSVIESIEYSIVENICHGESYDGYTNSGIYVDTLVFTDACDSIRTLALSVHSVFIPTAFSPNNDGTNDKFQIFAENQDLRIKTYQIYNRWGGKIYSMNEFNIGDFDLWWDGTYNNNALDVGLYVYYIELDCTEKIIPLKGHIAIIK